MAKNQYKFPPDAGSTNSGVVPSIGNCGRGIQRTGDIRHIGDLIPPAQTGTWTPGSIGQTVQEPVYDGAKYAKNISFSKGFDSQAAANTVGTFDGFDASGEGFDPFSSKQGSQA